jgi:GAF domain-containing protein
MHDTDPRLLKTLSSLNRIGAAINRIGSDNPLDVAAALRLIADSAVKVLGGASAVIYTYDPSRQAFDLASRITSGGHGPLPDEGPRPDGLGARAIRDRRPVLSYEEYGLTVHPAAARAGARVVGCFPLLVADQPLGALYVYRRVERHFTPLELLILENYANQAAMAIYHARRIARHAEELARREDEAARLRRAGLLISSRLGLEDTLQSILQMALEVISAQYGIIRLLDRGGQTLVTRAVAGEGLSRPQIEALPVDSNSVMGWVARNLQPVLIADLLEEPWASIYYPLDSELRMRSEIAVPLVGAGNRLEGVLNLESPAVNAFSEQDSHLLQSLAIQAVIAIQEARLLDALQEVAGLLLVQPLQPVLERLVELACDLLNGATSAIWLVNGEQLVLRATNAEYRRGARADTLPLRESLTGQVVLSGRPVVADDVRNDPHFSHTDLARAHDWQRALIVPIVSSDGCEPVGAFSVYRTAPDAERFTGSGWDEKVLTCLAHYAALAVQNAARQEALQSAQEQRAVAETFAAVGDVAANLLHQLNNKVGTIPVRIQGIQDKCAAALAADAYLAANLTEIERSAAQAMAVMRENLYHLHPIHRSPVSIVDCVRGAMVAAALPADVQVQLDGLDDLPPALGAPRSLTMVFANLFENAVEAMGGQGVIAVRGSVLSSAQLRIAVTDSGPGIPADLHERIFDLDFSRRSPRSGQSGRLGFGLWWVKTWMTRLGGSVSVESDGRHGTTFWLTLPRVKEA